MLDLECVFSSFNRLLWFSAEQSQQLSPQLKAPLLRRHDLSLTLTSVHLERKQEQHIKDMGGYKYIYICSEEHFQ